MSSLAAIECIYNADSTSRTDDGDGLDRNHKIGTGNAGAAHSAAGRGRHSEVTHARNAALLELVAWWAGSTTWLSRKLVRKRLPCRANFKASSDSVVRMIGSLTLPGCAGRNQRALVH